jgi:hypothetical protein
VNFCIGAEEFIYPSESITYAGMTIECAKGCGAYDDPDLQKSWSILETAINKTFRSLSVECKSSNYVRLPAKTKKGKQKLPLFCLAWRKNGPGDCF